MLVQADISLDKTNFLIKKYVELLSKKIEPKEILFLVQNSYKKKYVLNFCKKINVETSNINTFQGLIYKTVNENWDFEVISAEQERVNNTLITLTANIELNINDYFDKNSLEYLWTNKENESDIREMEFSKFSLYENKATLKSRDIDNTEEIYYLWIKVLDENGNEYFQKKVVNLTS